MTNQKNLRVINISLWLLQSLIAITFIWAGIMKLFQPSELPWPWVEENPELVIISGVLDLLFGLGLPYHLYYEFSRK